MTYVAFIAPASSGGTLTASFTKTNDPVEFSQSGALDKFNPALGTLTAATLRLTVHGDVSGSATRNATGGTNNVKLRLVCDAYFISSLGALDAIINDGMFSVGLVVDTAVFGMAAGTTHVFSSAFGSAFVDVDLSSILGALTGVGTFNVQGDSLSGNGVIGAGVASSSFSSLAGFDASITYTYT